MRLTTGGRVGIGTTSPSSTLDVNGTISVAGSVVHASDARWKDDIRTIDDALNKVMRLRGVEFSWRRDEFTHMRFEDGTQIGVIAQEVESVVPELVKTDREGSKSVAYANLAALLIEAVKEQQAEITQLRDQIESLDVRLRSVRAQ